ncbi:hypothetical protein HQ571_03170 [Candidatus Kuenenbacteria bacterium]|nr:hypothetical protein [Candidatus Kuenenbacteria bacterium]
MRWQAKYLILIVFILMVVTGMFFIYSNVNSPERIVYLKGEPSLFDKLECIVKGGKMENISELNEKVNFICHFH